MVRRPLQLNWRTKGGPGCFSGIGVGGGGWGEGGGDRGGEEGKDEVGEDGGDGGVWHGGHCQEGEYNEGWSKEEQFLWTQRRQALHL